LLDKNENEELNNELDGNFTKGDVDELDGDEGEEVY